MDRKLEKLIEQGKKFSFVNNSYRYEGDFFSRASDELLAWIAGIEHYLILSYDENSGPANLFKTLDRSQLSGNYQSSFDRQLQILRGVLISCKDTPPYKRKRQDDNAILSLIKNPSFWTVMAVLLGGTFALGLHLGNAKFDNNLIELSEEKRTLSDLLKQRDNLIQFIRRNSDSALNILSQMPYNEMALDSQAFRKVQSTIEKAGGVLYLNK